MDNIENLQLYNMRMAKSVLDKLFFLDMSVDLKKVLDFGCADGSLLKFVQLFCPEINLYGYDMLDEMINSAKKNVPNATFSSSLSEIKDKIFENGQEGSLINLSSLIHEVYSYSSAVEIDSFWDFVYKSGFEYISVRDMMLSETANRTTPIRDEMRIRTTKSLTSQIRDFENIHGSISNNKNFLHFLLKYKYVENWKREVNENYLPISTTKFFEIMPNDYEVVIYNRYALPYLVDSVKKDFGIEISDDTHVKILLRRKK